jgi:hypothetical protein
MVIILFLLGGLSTKTLILAHDRGNLQILSRWVPLRPAVPAATPAPAVSNSNPAGKPLDGPSRDRADPGGGDSMRWLFVDLVALMLVSGCAALKQTEETEASGAGSCLAILAAGRAPLTLPPPLILIAAADPRFSVRIRNGLPRMSLDRRGAG